MAHYRDVREEPGFTGAVAQIATRYPRVHDVLSALSWSLARAPHTHYQVPGTRYHVVETLSHEDAPDIPALRVLYWFDDERVTLVSVMLVEDTLGRES
jgi:hypothetical protein